MPGCCVSDGRPGFAAVLAQDKKLFDRGENASARLVQNLVKDGDDVGGSGGCSGVCGWGEMHSKMMKSDSVVTRPGGL
jgi:hypothetical protein